MGRQPPFKRTSEQVRFLPDAPTLYGEIGKRNELKPRREILQVRFLLQRPTVCGGTGYTVVLETTAATHEGSTPSKSTNMEC